MISFLLSYHLISFSVLLGFSVKYSALLFITFIVCIFWVKANLYLLSPIFVLYAYLILTFLFCVILSILYVLICLYQDFCNNLYLSAVIIAIFLSIALFISFIRLTFVDLFVITFILTTFKDLKALVCFFY